MTQVQLLPDLLAQGQNPACVDACPMRALEFGETVRAAGQVWRRPMRSNRCPPSSITQPSIVITPHKHAQISGTGNGRILELEKEV